MSRRTEIYKEIDDYIVYLRRKESSESKFSFFKIKKRKVRSELSESIQESEPIQETEESQTEQIDEIQQETQIFEDDKKGIISFVTNLFKKEEKDPDKDAVKLELYKTEMEQDAKKALQIADGLIKKIPNFELSKFMNSDEYEYYESVMRNYKLS